MPQYRATEKGFMGGRVVKPGTIINRDKPYSKKELPSWLEPVKASRQLKATTPTSEDSDMSFLDDVGSKSESTVETL